MDCYFIFKAAVEHLTFMEAKQNRYCTADGSTEFLCFLSVFETEVNSVFSAGPGRALNSRR